MNICIFCSAYTTDDKYVKPAEELATLLAKAGHHLVWGGSDVGLMHIVAEAFRNNGGKIYGVSLEVYKHKNHKSADEMIIAKDLGTRKAAMLARSDVIVALPGGTGTLDELTEIIELRKQGHNSKPIVIVNTDGFYDGLIMQLTRMFKEGFIPKSMDDLVYFASEPKEVLGYITTL